MQRVTRASVSWADHRSAIGSGLMILVGVGPADDESHATRLADKVAELRIFPDAGGKPNLSLLDIKGEALVVSQFTLFGDMARGRRPSYVGAGAPEKAAPLYERFAEALRARGIRVGTGSFGAHMKVELCNDGPVTLVLSTDDWSPRV